MAIIKNKILIVKTLLSGICILFLAVTFHTENRSSGWYQQFLPNLNGQTISDVFFLDSLTGWAVTGTNSGPGHINYIIKTTNGGDNWNIVFTDTCFFSKVKFIASNIGFACGGDGGGFAYFYKSTNGGINWIRLFNTGAAAFEDMSIMNQDTIRVVDHNSFTGGVFLTTNGGLSWTQQFSAETENPNKIYMFNARIGFICNTANGTSTRKTTDGGNSWFIVALNDAFYDIYFADSLTGWKVKNNVKKTTNGGLNWIQQQFPTPGTILGGIRKLSAISRDTIWGSGVSLIYPNSQIRGILYRTTNGGNNWYYQIPDTSFEIEGFNFIQFLDKFTGWAYPVAIHTITGGDTTFLSGIQKISNEIPQNYILHQNYPNPFNPRTVIGYEIKKTGNKKLDVFDILGKEVMTLVNEKQNAGKYEVDYMGKFSPSGIYFYRLMVNGKIIDTKKMLLVK